MSKLKKLIEQLCPDGVEYKTFGECGDFYGGLTGKTKKDFGEGSPFLTYIGIFSHAEARFNCVDYVRLKDGEKQNAVHRGDVLITVSSETPDECGMTCVVTKEPDEATYLNSFCTGWRPYDVGFAEPDYLKYALRSYGVRQQIVRTANGVTRFNVSKPLLAKVSFPIPPIEVQREIVRILDSMQELDDALSEELVHRESQLNALQDMLLTRYIEEACGDVIEYKQLSEVCSLIKAGGDAPDGCVKGQFEPDDERPYPVYSNGTGDSALYGYAPTYTVTEKAVTISARGSIGFHEVREGGFTPIVRLLSLVPNEDVTAEYLDIALSKCDLTGSQGNISQLTVPMVKDRQIPVPPKNVQHDIVEVIGTMKRLIGEIENERRIRRRQFEHYRDKLLDFPEKEAVA